MRSWWQSQDAGVKVGVVGAILAFLALLPAYLAVFPSSKTPSLTTSSTPPTVAPTSSVESTTTESSDTTTDGTDTIIETSTTEKVVPVKVPIAELCNNADSVYICEDEEIEVGDRIFSYEAENNGFASTRPPNWGRILYFPGNTCVRLVVRFAVSDHSSEPGNKANLRVIQSRSSTATASTPRGSIGTLSASLDRGPFRLEGNSTDGAQVFVSGYAVCNTPSGQ